MMVCVKFFMFILAVLIAYCPLPSLGMSLFDEYNSEYLRFFDDHRKSIAERRRPGRVALPDQNGFFLPNPINNIRPLRYADIEVGKTGNVHEDKLHAYELKHRSIRAAVAKLTGKAKGRAMIQKHRRAFLPEIRREDRSAGN